VCRARSTSVVTASIPPPCLRAKGLPPPVPALPPKHLWHRPPALVLSWSSRHPPTACRSSLRFDADTPPAHAHRETPALRDPRSSAANTYESRQETIFQQAPHCAIPISGLPAVSNSAMVNGFVAMPLILACILQPALRPVSLCSSVSRLCYHSVLNSRIPA
jgi:hypothetical protein